jgi:hypothetical protein
MADALTEFFQIYHTAMFEQRLSVPSVPTVVGLSIIVHGCSMASVDKMLT